MADFNTFRIQSIAPPVMKGSLMKRGSFRPNWKNRFFVLERGRLMYFEPSHWLQVGERDLTSFSIEENPSATGENTIILKSCKNFPTLILKAKNINVRDLWIASLNAHISFAHLIAENPILLLRIAQRVINGDRSSIAVKEAGIEHQLSESISSQQLVNVDLDDDDTVDTPDTPIQDEDSGFSSPSSQYSCPTLSNQPAEPPVMKGWVLKQGHIVRNWKSRYCILDRGELRYYSVFRSNTDGAKFEHVLKGRIQLRGYTVSHENITGEELILSD
jgi:hypothetical protein